MTYQDYAWQQEPQDFQQNKCSLTNSSGCNHLVSVQHTIPLHTQHLFYFNGFLAPFHFSANIKSFRNCYRTRSAVSFPATTAQDTGMLSLALAFISMRSAKCPAKRQNLLVMLFAFKELGNTRTGKFGVKDEMEWQHTYLLSPAFAT